MRKHFIYLIYTWIGSLIILSGFNPIRAQFACDSISTLSCSNIVVSMPYSLTFSGSAGGMLDSAGISTGFTMVKKATNRSSADLPVSNPLRPGYEPGRLRVTNSRLQIKAGKGEAYGTQNSQINAVGVGIQAGSKVIVMETKLLDHSPGGGYAQSGIWYGTGQNNYMKLNAQDTLVELMLEQNGLLVEKCLKGITVPSGKYLKLKLVVDNRTSPRRVRAYYQIEGESEVLIREIIYNINAITLSDGVTSGVTFGGLYAAYVQGSTFTAKFDNFDLYEDTQASLPCSGISPFSCDLIPVSLPYYLDFDGSDVGVIDSLGQGTGFTMVAKATNRHSSDATVSFSSVRGYEPKYLKVQDSVLHIGARKGEFYLNTNNQLNALGIGVKATARLIHFQTTLLSHAPGTGNAQAGLWYGLDEQNYVKLSAEAGRVEFRLEKTGSSSASQVGSKTYTPATNKNIKLRLEVDNRFYPGVIRGYFQVEGQTEQKIDKEFILDFVPATLSDTLTGITYAGVYATQSGGSAFTARFKDFKALTGIASTPQCDLNSPLACLAIPVNPYLNLNFDGNNNGLVDMHGKGTGFTMVLMPPKRATADLPITDASLLGYEPSRIEMQNGQIKSGRKGRVYQCQQ
ncbi:MAG: hypothetical protein HC880_19115 [Bacteroidia bacterium]|nr:hypothetical protein [Bacteroidia bacterium]